MSTASDDAATPRLGRRRFLQVAAAGTIGAAGVGQLTHGAAADWSDVGETVLKTTSPAGYLVMEGADLATGEVFSYDGFTSADAIAEVNYDRFREMRSADETTAATLHNLMESARNVAWFRGKKALVEAMQNGETSDATTQASKDAVSAYYADAVQKNLLNHVNEQFVKVEDVHQRVVDHADLSVNTHVEIQSSDWPDETYTFEFNTKDVTLVNENTETMHWIRIINDGTNVGRFDVDQPDTVGQRNFIRVWTNDDRSTLWGHMDNAQPWTKSAFDTWLDEDSTNDWEDLRHLNRFAILWDWIQQDHSTMQSNIEEFAADAYDAVQAGEIEIADLITPAMLASEFSTRYDETGHYAYAASDLASLGLNADYENEMVVELNDGSVLEGTLFVQSDDFSASVGETIDPANYGHVEMTFNPQTFSRQLPDGEYRESIDGGEFYLEGHEPVEQGLYQITTSHGETVDVAWDEFTDQAPADDSTELWSVDLSDRLSSSITNAVEVNRYFTEGAGEGGRYVIEEPFTIVEAYDVESGEAVDTVQGQSYNTQTADVTRTREELEALRQALDDAGAFEDSTSSDGGAGGILPDGWSWDSDRAVVGAVVGGLLALGILNSLTS